MYEMSFDALRDRDPYIFKWLNVEPVGAAG
jgi:hypothetical protein